MSIPERSTTARCAASKLVRTALALTIACPASLQAAASLRPPEGFSGVIWSGDAGSRTRGVTYGAMDPSGRRGFRFNARWRLASFTKQVVAVLVMQSVEHGRLQLDAPVSRWLPSFAGRAITVRQMLTHQSGVTDPDANDTVADRYYALSEVAQRAFCAGTPRATPGAEFRYNNCDFVTLGALLERVEGKPWFELVRTRINARAGTRFTLDDAGAIPGFIDGKPEMKLTARAFGAAGALHGTLADVIRFDRALLSGKLLTKDARDEMWKGDPAKGSVALGQWSYAAPLKGCTGAQAIVERRGQIGGVQLRNLIFPDSGRILIVLTNRGEFPFGEVWQGRGAMYDLAGQAVCP